MGNMLFYGKFMVIYGKYMESPNSVHGEQGGKANKAGPGSPGVIVFEFEKFSKAPSFELKSMGNIWEMYGKYMGNP